MVIWAICVILGHGYLVLLAKWPVSKISWANTEYSSLLNIRKLMHSKYPLYKYFFQSNDFLYSLPFLVFFLSFISAFIWFVNTVISFDLIDLHESKSVKKNKKRAQKRLEARLEKIKQDGLVEKLLEQDPITALKKKLEEAKDSKV